MAHVLLIVPRIGFLVSKLYRGSHMTPFVGIVGMMLAGSAFASNVSVNIDGQTYQCSGQGGGGQSHVLCQCYQDHSNGGVRLLWHLINESGVDVTTRELSRYDANSWDEAQRNCEASLAQNPSCRS